MELMQSMYRISLLCFAGITRDEEIETLAKNARYFFLPNTSVVVHKTILFY